MNDIKTKIVATIGPASNSLETLKKLIQAGVNVFRLNFSHGTHEEHSQTLASIRKASDELGIIVAVLQDLAGPKIRISEIENATAPVDDGDLVKLKFADGSLSSSDTVYVNTINPAAVLKPGHQVLFADGTIQMITESVADDHAICKVVRGGNLRSRVGIAFPDSELTLPVTTEKDLKDLDWGLKNNVDFVALSFVQSAENISKLRGFIDQSDSNPKVIAKIERRVALEKIDEIMNETDAIMVARGDLGVEIPIEQIPLLERELIAKANHAGKPVIVATQMLHSMVHCIRPTRAEVVDCAFAVMSGTDAVMLSEETAIGKNPVEAVEYLVKISKDAERSFQFEEYKLRLRDSDRNTVSDAVAYAACAAASKVKAAAIIACTETGTTARLVAKYRPSQPLYAASKVKETLRRMCLYWGVVPIACQNTDNRSEEIDEALKLAQNAGNFENGTMAVALGGLSVGAAGSTSVMEVKIMNYKK